jgi:pimeloyl-ACP methyl ester carboxylesterase
MKSTNKNLRAALLLAIACMGAGCATPVGVRPVDRREVRRLLSADAISANEPSIASRQVLLRLGMAERMRREPEAVLAELHTRTIADVALDGKTTSDRLFALAEYSYLHAYQLGKVCKRPLRSRGPGARKPQPAHKPSCETARAYYVAASMYAYAFAFPDDSRAPPSPIDPRLRTAVDIYNLAITSTIRQLKGEAAPHGFTYPFHLGQLEIQVDPEGLHYADRRLGDFVPAAELEVRGLRIRYRQAGIGAPFVAKAIQREGVELPLTSARVVAELRVPVTVIVRYDDLTNGLRSGEFHGRIEIYTEGRTTEIEVGGQQLPLEYETTAALAYSLEHSELWAFEIAGFRSGDALPAGMKDGLEMLQPYRPGKIPVVLVHGTASSPARWAEMLNELHSDPTLRTNYQFWIFTYSTGNPILYSASLLREALQNTLTEIDPDGLDPALRRMVVVGHSQGGLLAKLQVIPSGTLFWDSTFDTPFEEVEMRPESREMLRKAIFFEPQEFIELVVFIATPHRGSFFAGGWRGRFASRLFNAPKELVSIGVELARSGVSSPSRDGQNADLKNTLAHLPSSVDNMNPDAQFIRNIQSIPVAPQIHAHSIIPVRGSPPPEGKNDGVVEYSSAHIDEAESEYVVYGSSHSTQSHPETIRELRRILLEHLDAP